MLLNHKNVKTQKEVYVVEFQDRYTVGNKYVVRTLQTDYTSFFASPFENYYKNEDEALLVAKDLNRKDK